MSEPRTDNAFAEVGVAILVIRSLVGGFFMGLANLVPGISGGTMLLASGIYPQFIEGVADLTRLRFRFRSLLVLGVVGTSGVVAFVVFAALVKGAVVEYRSAMYGLFIGLTLGGVPVVWGLIGETTRGMWAGVLVGFIGMSALAWAQMQQVGGGAEAGWMMMLVAGVVGASAMILPGVSGAYLLLILGVYLPVLGAIEQTVTAARGGDVAGLQGPVLYALLPIGIGVVVGIAVVSNGLKWVLERYEKPTLGVLLGLLVGAVVGLWPFQRGVKPVAGDMYRGRVVEGELLNEMLEKPHRWATEFYTPSTMEAAIVLGLIVLGFIVTAAVAWIGRDRRRERIDSAAE